MQEKRRYQAAGAAFCLFIISCLIVYFDPEFNHRWTAFSLWTISLVILIFAFSNINIKNIKLPLNDPYFFLIVFLCLSRVIFLFSYPYTGVGDALRDGGLRPEEIANGQWKNIFGFDWSQGVTLPAYLSILYHFFDPQISLIRIPAAIISIADILLIYFLVKKSAGKYEAFFTALAIICCHFHWYYGRTEILIEFTSFFTTLLIFLLYRLYKNPDSLKFGMVAFTCGFSLSFHASVWIIAMMSMAFAGIFSINFYKKNFKNIILINIFMAACLLTGYGPRIIYAPEYYSGFSGGVKTNAADYYTIFSNYIISLRIIFLDHANMGHFPGNTIYSFFAGIILLIGIPGLFRKTTFSGICALIVIITVPFINGALSDKPGAEYRVFPIVTAGAILIGSGMGFILEILKSRKNVFLNACAVIFALIFSCQELYGLKNSFLSESASNPVNRSTIIYEYILTDMFRIIRKNIDQIEGREICILTDPDAGDYLNFMHINEYMRYFLPEFTINHSFFPGKQDILMWSVYFGECPDNIVKQHWKVYEFCRVYRRFVCPPTEQNYIIRFSELNFK